MARQHESFLRSQRRTTRVLNEPEMKRPNYWERHRGFNPYLVRGRAPSITHSVGKKIGSASYAPFAPVSYKVPKGGGAGTRDVSVYQVADATVSLLLYRGLIRKNAARLSQRAYAYRNDRTSVDALLYLREELRDRKRVYVAEYDFSKFFDSIDHEYVRRTLVDGNYLMTELERTLIEQFLTSRLAVDPYDPESTARRTVGLPQGTSVSLFLANVAATPIDRQLERIGVGFARYADDTLLFDSDYGRISQAVEALHDVSELMGVAINQSKSPGIRILVPGEESSAEFASTVSIDYLGYRVSEKSLAFKKSVEDKIKERTQRLVYENLVREPLKGTQDPARLTVTDRDYVTLVWQMRRYLYGNLSEREVRRFAAGEVPNRKFIGLMSFFPLVDDAERLAELDAWITRTVWSGLRRRRLLLGATAVGSTPHGKTIAEIRRLKITSGKTGASIDLTLPSVALMASVIRSAVAAHGASVVNGSSTPYSYNAED